MDTNSEQFRKKIEKRILHTLKDLLQNHTVNAKRVQDISQYVINNIKPGMTYEEIYQVITTLNRFYPELTLLVTLTIQEHRDFQKKLLAPQIESLIRERKLVEASMLLHQINRG